MLGKGHDRKKEESKRLRGEKDQIKIIIVNCKAISLYPICGKMFEKIVCDVIYQHFSDNDLSSFN